MREHGIEIRITPFDPGGQFLCHQAQVCIRYVPPTRPPLMMDQTGKRIIDHLVALLDYFQAQGDVAERKLIGFIKSANRVKVRVL